MLPEELGCVTLIVQSIATQTCMCQRYHISLPIQPQQQVRDVISGNNDTPAPRPRVRSRRPIGGNAGQIATFAIIYARSAVGVLCGFTLPTTVEGLAVVQLVT